jgi:hypothetical protein
MEIEVIQMMRRHPDILSCSARAAGDAGAIASTANCRIHVPP